MPDRKKLAVLEKARYELHETCLTCASLERSSDSSLWGWCTLLVPQHEKHTDGGRVSVHVSGWCPQFEVTAAVGMDLLRSGFDRFIPSDPDPCSGPDL